MSYPRESLGHSPASIAHARQVSHPKRLISGASPLTEPCPDGQCVTTMWAAGHWEEQPVGAPSRSTSQCPAAHIVVTHWPSRSEEHTSELQSLAYLVCRLLLEKKKAVHR